MSQDQEEQAFFAVFDGHGGVDAAIYAANHLHVNLVHQECFSQDASEALCRAFKLTDERFVKKASREVKVCLPYYSSVSMLSLLHCSYCSYIFRLISHLAFSDFI